MKPMSFIIKAIKWEKQKTQYKVTITLFKHESITKTDLDNLCERLDQSIHEAWQAWRVS